MKWENISDNGGVYMTIITCDIIFFQGNKLIVTDDTNLNLKDFICQNKARPNLTFKLI